MASQFRKICRWLSAKLACSKISSTFCPGFKRASLAVNDIPTTRGTSKLDPCPRNSFVCSNTQTSASCGHFFIHWHFLEPYTPAEIIKRHRTQAVTTIKRNVFTFILAIIFLRAVLFILAFNGVFVTLQPQIALALSCAMGWSRRNHADTLPLVVHESAVVG